MLHLLTNLSIIFYFFYLVVGSAFPQMHITMKHVGLRMPIFLKLKYRPNIYDKNSIIASTNESWNKNQNYLKNVSLRLLSPEKTKLFISVEYLKNIEPECFFIFNFIIVLYCCKEMISLLFSYCGAVFQFLVKKDFLT